MDKFIGKWAFPADDSLLEGSARRGKEYDFSKIASDIVDKLNFTKDDIVLDVCCGNSALTKIISRYCKQIHGVDHSGTLLKSAEKLKMEEGILNMNLYLADAMEVDKIFSPDTFDKSYCYFSFQYFNKKKRELLLEKLVGVTKSNGLILLGDVPDKSRIWNFYDSKKKFYREKISRIVKFKQGECNLGWWVYPEEIIRWGEKHNLKVSILPQVNLPHAHYRFDALIRNNK